VSGRLSLPSDLVYYQESMGPCLLPLWGKSVTLLCLCADLSVAALLLSWLVGEWFAY
jgi:hypothetical protein